MGLFDSVVLAKVLLLNNAFYAFVVFLKIIVAFVQSVVVKCASCNDNVLIT